MLRLQACGNGLVTAAFEELKQREIDDEANGVVVDYQSRPRVQGGAD